MLKRNIRIAWALAWAVFFCPCVVAYSQTADSPGGDVVQDDAGTASPAKEVQTAQKSDKAVEEKTGGKTGVDDKKAGKSQDTVETPKDEGGSRAEQLSGAGGLLDLSDGDFLYRRIPDKKFPQATSLAGDAFLSDAAVNPEENPDMSQRKGLFGLSARATDYLAKGFLVFIILMIVILYRMRSKSRRSTVHKSFR